MSGNPRWLYARDGSQREPVDYSRLLAEICSDSGAQPVGTCPGVGFAGSRAHRGAERVELFGTRLQVRHRPG